MCNSIAVLYWRLLDVGVFFFLFSHMIFDLRSSFNQFICTILWRQSGYHVFYHHISRLFSRAPSLTNFLFVMYITWITFLLFYHIYFMFKKEPENQQLFYSAISSENNYIHYNQTKKYKVGKSNLLGRTFWKRWIKGYILKLIFVEERTYFIL